MEELLHLVKLIERNECVIVGTAAGAALFKEVAECFAITIILPFNPSKSQLAVKMAVVTDPPVVKGRAHCNP